MRILIITGLLVPTVISANPTAYPESALPELADLLKQAGIQAPELIQQSLAKEESNARLDAARSAYYPTLDLDATYGLRQDYYDSDKAKDKTQIGLNFAAVIKRPIYYWGAIEAAIQQARLDQTNEDLQRVYLLRKIKRGLRADYLTLRLNQLTLSNLQLSRAIAQDGIDRVQSDFQAGTVAEQDADLAKVNLQQTLLNISRIEADQKRILAAYKRKLGWDAPLSLSDPLPAVDAETLATWASASASTDPSTWTESNGEILSRENLVAREKEELIRVKAQQRPLVSFAASAGLGQKNVGNETGIATLSTFIGLDVSWNIFDGFKTSARKRETLAKMRRLERQLESFRAELTAQATDVLTQIGFIARQYQLEQKRAQLAESTLKNQQKSADDGRTSIQSLRQYQLRAGETKLALMEQQVALILAQNDFLDLTLPAAVDLSFSIQ